MSGQHYEEDVRPYANTLGDARPHRRRNPGPTLSSADRKAGQLATMVPHSRALTRHQWPVVVRRYRA
jgi:hypothetical protein